MGTVIAFVIIFGSLVFFHELGHFIFAKRAGIMVREFAIGFGPKIIGITKGETLYTIRLLPLGGYVRMAGEDFDKVELQPGYRVGLYIGVTNEVEKIYLNRNVANPDVLFLETESSDLEKELFIEGYDDDGQLLRYNVSRKAVIVEKGQETIIAPYDTVRIKVCWEKGVGNFRRPPFQLHSCIFHFSCYWASTRDSNE